MSFTVVRGEPHDAQLYLDKVIDNLLLAGATRPGVHSREEVNLIEIIFYSMRTNLERVHLINAGNGEKFTNGQILKRGVSLARALRAKGATGKTAIIMLRNHEHMAALYYGMLLAGVVSFMVDLNFTEYSLQHFITLASPFLVFCENDHRDVVTNALRQSGAKSTVVFADGPSMDAFAEGCSDDIDSFELPQVGLESTAIMLNTSGSTGVPESVMLSHQGLVIQLPRRWMQSSKFPQPIGMVMLLTTGHWMSHTMMMTSCPVYQVPILVSPRKLTVEEIAQLCGTYRPTCAFLVPSTAIAIGNIASAEQLSSIELMWLGGAPFTEENVAVLTSKLPKSAFLAHDYGITEMHGSVAGGLPSVPLTSIGPIANFVHYKLLNDDGEEILEPYRKGELYMKSKCLFKGYVNNEAAYHRLVMPDGWLKTGDVFYKDENDMLYFVYRKKLRFKSLGEYINPEEIEKVINSIPGVQQCVVTGAGAGPAAAVTLAPGRDVTRASIHQAVALSLSEHHRLRGGVAFVQVLPRISCGKIDRRSSLQLIHKLITNGQCF